MRWRDHAACRDEDPELFFPAGTRGPARAQIARAKTVCRRCPVSAQCLQWALDSGQDSGVWGGASATERRALRRQHLTAHPQGRQVADTRKPRCRLPRRAGR